MSEINIIDDFYIPLQTQEEAYSNKKYKLLVENDIDPAELVGLKKDANSSVIKLGEEQEGQKEDLYKEVLDYAAALPKDLLISVVRGGVNGSDFIKDLAAFATYGNQELPDDSVFKFIDERIEAIKIETNSERSVLKKLQKYARLSAVRGSSSIDDIRGIAAKGGYLSSEELGLILETGGFSSINDTKDTLQEAPKQGRLRKKKTRKLGVSRRGGRKGKSASRRD